MDDYTNRAVLFWERRINASVQNRRMKQKMHWVTYSCDFFSTGLGVTQLGGKKESSLLMKIYAHVDSHLIFTFTAFFLSLRTKIAHERRRACGYLKAVSKNISLIKHNA